MAGLDLAAWWAPFLAFAAGAVAFASPCVLPLVPGYVSFVSASGAPGDPGRRRLVPVLLFVAGFSVVFTSLGVFAGALIPLVRSVTGQRVAGLVVVAAGVFLLMYALRIGWAPVYAEHRPWLSRVRPGVATAFPLGMAFAAGWTPCIGPVLAGTLALATAQADPLEERTAPVLVLARSRRSVPPGRPRGGRAAATPGGRSAALPRRRTRLRRDPDRDRDPPDQRAVGPSARPGPPPGHLLPTFDLIEGTSPR